jgi:YhcH/YjgK/YiaL family protein
MIIDKLDRAKRYYNVHPLFEEAFRFLETIGQFEPGEKLLKGTALKAIFQEVPGRSRKEARLEAHRKYIDIQYTLVGEEEIGWSPKEACKTVSEPYSPEKDIEFFRDRPLVFIPIPHHSFAIFFPEDAHAPFVARCTLQKIILKVQV